jgi:hypothetical protein
MLCGSAGGSVPHPFTIAVVGQIWDLRPYLTCACACAFEFGVCPLFLKGVKKKKKNKSGTNSNSRNKLEQTQKRKSVLEQTEEMEQN